MRRRDVVKGGAAAAFGAAFLRFAPAGAQAEPGVDVSLDFTQIPGGGTQAGPFTGTVLDPDGVLWDLEGTATPNPSGPPGGGVLEFTDLTIVAGATLELDPATDTVLTLNGRTEVMGTLRSHPNPGVTHEIVVVCDEAAYGGGDAHMGTDPGVYVMGAGVLDLVGTQRTAWTRATGDIAQGATSFTVADATGWKPGDSLVIAPSVTRNYGGANWWQAYDYATVVSVVGSTVTVDTATTHPHPVRLGRGCEVINLSSNVAVRSDVGTRGHIMFMGTAAQHLADVTVDGLGSRGTSGEILGRYPLHFHRAGEGTRGSTLNRVVVANSDRRGFVPHESHGITFTGCASHSVRGAGYWWDDDDQTDDCLWHDCLASRTVPLQPSGWPGADDRGLRLPGFLLGEGEGCEALRCVDVGNHGETGAGFVWSATANLDPNHWLMEDCEAHNSRHAGILVWQNDPEVRPVDRFTAWSCVFGIDHGAYNNAYHYTDITVDDAGGVVKQHSQGPTVYSNVVGTNIDGTGVVMGPTNHIGDTPFTVDGLNIDGAPGVFVNGTKADEPNQNRGPDLATLRNINAAGEPVLFAPNLHPDALITLEHGGQVLELRPDTWPGDTSGMSWSAAWNCWVADVTT